MTIPSNRQDVATTQPGHLPSVSNLATSLQVNIERQTDAKALPSRNDAGEDRTRRDTTFYKSASIFINEPVGSMSLSPANRDVVLAARKGLYIVDLESPFAPPRFLAQLSTWEAADVQWSPHPSRAHWVASTSNDRLLIWNLDRPEGAPRGPLPLSERDSGPNSAAASTTRLAGGTYTTASASSPEGMSPKSQVINPFRQSLSVPSSASSPRSSAIEYVLSAHKRAITDINFSAHHPDVLASCGIDAWSWVWDLRTPSKPVQGYSAWNAPATQIKWNRSSPHRLATAVDNKVLIWDDRKGALPLATIEAHVNQIYGLDWSRATSSRGLDCFVTCSLDGAVKFWDLGTPASQAAIATRTLVTEPEQVIQTSTPIWRARHLPFGQGVMTLPQRGDTTLSMWSKDRPEDGPAEQFAGHKDLVKEYLFRTRGGADPDHDDRRFQLITWSKDQTLRLWPVSEEAMKKVGHVPGSKIKVLQTRIAARDISYRDAPYLTAPQDLAGKTSTAGDGRNVNTYHHPSAGTSTGTSPGVASPKVEQRSQGTLASSPATLMRNGLLSSSLSDRSGMVGPLSHTGASPSTHLLLSRSFPKSVSRSQPGAGSGDKGLSYGSGLTVGGAGSVQSHDTRNSGGMASTGKSSFVAPANAVGGGRYASLLGARNESTSAGHAAGNANNQAAAARRSKRRSKRLAQGAASTYMTRGSGAALGADLLRMKVGTLYSSQNRRSRNEAVSWITGVKVDKYDQRTRRSKSEEMKPSSSGGDLVLKRPTLSSRGISEGTVLGPSSRQDSDQDKAGAVDLQEEIIDVSKELPQVSYEKVDIAKRACILCLYGPWAKGGPVYMRLSLRFPQSYPSEAPSFDLDHNAFVSLKTRAFLLRALRAIIAECVAQMEGCMKPCARFLAGSRTIEVGDDVVLAPQSAPLGDDSDEEEGAAVKEDSRGRGQMIRLLPGARCGARFSPSGHLVIFNTVKPSTNHSRAQSRLRNVIASMPEPPGVAGGGGDNGASTSAAPFHPESTSASVSAGGIGSRPAGGRFLTSYASITSAMESLTRMANDTFEEDPNRSRISPMEKAGIAGQTPEVMHLMDTKFLARRLQARSGSKRSDLDEHQKSSGGGGGVKSEVRVNDPLNDPTSNSGRGRERQVAAAATQSSTPYRDLSPLTKGPARSRSVAIGRERRIVSPLLASTRLVHTHSEVKIYKFDVSALTLKISRMGEEARSLSDEGKFEVRGEERGGGRWEAEEGGRGEDRNSGGTQRSHTRPGELPTKPLMGRKRSASSPSALMRGTQ